MSKKTSKRRRYVIPSLILFLILILFFVKGDGLKTQKGRILYSGVVTATAYNSEVGQCDSTPWTTAAGTRCREGVIAANFLPIGTKVRIEGFKRTFVVEDRMHRRFSSRIDIWFRHRHEALSFGKRKIKYYVIA